MDEPDPRDVRLELDRLLLAQRETEHRVKNTLQLISSIVLLQSRRTPDPAARAALNAVLQRVTAVSLAHRHVSWVNGVEQVDATALVREVALDLAGGAGRDDIALALELDPLLAPAAQAAPLALLVNESLGNALRHAFPDGRRGRVSLSLRREDGGFELAVDDDGVGMADGAPPKGFGLTIVQLLAQQLRGRLVTDAAQPGLRLSVHVPMNPQAPPPAG